MLTSQERKVLAGITFVVSVRMLGLFLLLPVLAPFVKGLDGSTPILVGLAMGAYGLTQAVLQIPFGYLSDKYSRKLIITLGLMFHILGSLWAGLSPNIWHMVAARFLQGAGAISSSAIALAADLIREDVRTRAFAHIGASIGMVFALSIVVAPVLAGSFGVPFIFFLTAGLSALSLIYLLLFIPEKRNHTREVEPSLKNIALILRDRNQLLLDLSIAILHVFLVSMFTVVPVELIERFGIPKPEHWKIYLPIILVSLFIMVPSTILAERKGKIKEVFITGILLIIIGFTAHSLLPSFWGLIAMLFLYFVGFHLLEPIIPSLLTRFAHRDMRGLSTGIYNTVQFTGAFLGGILGGIFLKLGISYMLYTYTLTSIVWFLLIFMWKVDIKKEVRR